ncbi:MAG: hypothetical protein Q8P67_13075, partial [archaeon]|nr:hypothetical protein [archaeon]
LFFFMQRYPLISLQSIHQFSRVHFNKPTWCHGCSDFIWGLGYQGFECNSCKRPYHPKCMLAATSDCPGR